MHDGNTYVMDFQFDIIATFAVRIRRVITVTQITSIRRGYLDLNKQRKTKYVQNQIYMMYAIILCRSKRDTCMNRCFLCFSSFSRTVVHALAASQLSIRK